MYPDDPRQYCVSLLLNRFWLVHAMCMPELVAYSMPETDLISPRHSDFLFGLPTSHLPCEADFDSEPLTPAERLRLVYYYITSMSSDGGLGIVPGSKDWNLVDSVMALHDREFNENLIRSWATHQITSAKLEEIREQVRRASPPINLSNSIACI